MPRSLHTKRPIPITPLAAVAWLAAMPAAAQTSEPIEITGHYDNAVGTSDSASQGVIGAGLLKSRPALRPGEVLEFVPGVIVTQHSGDGKANQYFLRGFNLDHGTDFATSVNGIPVNMPTHGHGQGYTDLNFLIPELVQRIEYRKGPYFASTGDFSSAGSADIVYRTTLDAPFVQLAGGEEGYKRGVLAGSTDVGGGLRVLGAFELMRNDGPWKVDENLHRSNGVVTASSGSAPLGWSASVMGYKARWTSTDQVPEMAIDDGVISRYGSLDPSDGGSTARYSVSGEWHRLGDEGATQVSAFAMQYRLRLFSNFTYFLDDPVNGDQFSQTDNRHVYGLKASHNLEHRIGPFAARTELGLQLRHDRIHVGLFSTREREVLDTRRNDQVDETLAGLYAQTAVELLPQLRAIVGVRGDRIHNKVASRTEDDFSGKAHDSQVSPKLSLIAGPFEKTELFANAGRGLHSNDARSTTVPDQRATPLVESRGWELGARTEIVPGLQSSLALWQLDFDSELVYVGDAGETEEGPPSRRRGVEWNNRWVPVPWFLFDADLAWTHPRFRNGDRIPNSVDRVASVAATLRDLSGWSASLQWRYLGPGALIEDNSVRSHPAPTFNLRVAKRFLDRFEATLDVFNLLDRKVDDIQYDYESRVTPGAPVTADRHIHPAEPRTLRFTLKMTL